MVTREGCHFSTIFTSEDEDVLSVVFSLKSGVISSGVGAVSGVTDFISSESKISDL
jgi:hypothetical protein